jgi:hypothetical protein
VHRLRAILTLAVALGTLGGCEAPPSERYTGYGGIYRPYAAPAYPLGTPPKNSQRGYGRHEEDRSAPGQPSYPPYGGQPDYRPDYGRSYSERRNNTPYSIAPPYPRDDEQQEEDRSALLPYEDRPAYRRDDAQRDDRDLQNEPRDNGRPSLGLPTWR